VYPYPPGIYRYKARPVAGQKQRRAPGAWERYTNKVQRKLTRIYDAWSARIRRELERAAKRGAIGAEQYAILERGISNLEKQMVEASADAVKHAGRLSAKSRATLPVVEQTITRGVLNTENIVKQGLIPVVMKKVLPDVLRAAGDKKILSDAFLSVRNAPAQTAGSSWVTIFEVQRTLGRERARERISEGKEPEPVRWVLDPAAEHCHPSAGRYGCLELAGEYPSWDSLPTVPAGNVTCLGNCRCRLEVLRDGKWQRGVYPD